MGNNKVQLEKAEQDVIEAEERVEAARERYERARAAMESPQIKQAEADLAQAEAELAALQQQLMPPDLQKASADLEKALASEIPEGIAAAEQAYRQAAVPEPETMKNLSAAYDKLSQSNPEKEHYTWEYRYTIFHTSQEGYQRQVMHFHNRRS